MTLRLRPYQRSALAYAKPRNRIALFMEMRLGKSIVTIRWSKARKHEHVLLAVPNEPMWGWLVELEGEGVDGFRPRSQAEFSELEVLGAPYGWTMVTYGRLRASPWLLDLDWDAMVLDEPVEIKSPKSRISKLLTSRRVTVGDRAILTGLPNPEGTLDYYQQLRFLFPSFMGCRNFWNFRVKYFDQVGFDWLSKADTDWRVREELKKLAFTLSRESAGIKNTKIYERRVVPLPPRIARIHKKALKEFSGYLKRGGEVWTSYATKAAMYASKIASGFDAESKLVDSFKINALADLLEGELRKEPVVVWARFNAEIRTIKRKLKERGVRKAAVLTGEVKSGRERDRLVRLFQEGKLDTLVVQGKLGRYGLKLSRATAAVYFSNHWDLNTRKQTEDRILDVEDESDLLLVDLVAEGTVDEDAADALQEKGVEAAFFTANLKRRFERRISALHDS